ncbi:MAG: hypothetical protein IJ412_05075 [Oscillospiraceae bacterium]|nr:hypothetical protein [Oscillospiraceae bacterium]
MSRHSGKVKLNIPMCLACVLLCLTLISIRMTGGLYAKYISTGSGGDSARVITFGELSLTETGDFTADDKNAFIIPGVDLVKDARVNFSGSEAAVIVFAEVQVSDKWTISADSKTYSFTSGSTALMQWSIADSWTLLPRSSDSLYPLNNRVFYRVLQPNEALENAPILANEGKITVSSAITRHQITGMDNLFINLRAYAVQAGGFESIADAWSSVFNHA